jgi:hypothetical protein
MKELSKNRQFSGRFYDIFIFFGIHYYIPRPVCSIFWEPASTQVCIYLLIAGGYMSIILRTAKHWLTYWGQLMSHDLHWPENTWSVIIHRSLTKSKYRFWVVEWFEFPIWHILAYSTYEWSVPQFWTWFSFWESRTLCDHEMPIFCLYKTQSVTEDGFK